MAMKMPIRQPSVRQEPMTEDDEKLVRRLFADAEWGGKSIMAIAKKCGLDVQFVDKVRKAVNKEQLMCEFRAMCKKWETKL